MTAFMNLLDIRELRRIHADMAHAVEQRFTAGHFTGRLTEDPGVGKVRDSTVADEPEADSDPQE